MIRPFIFAIFFLVSAAQGATKGGYLFQSAPLISLMQGLFKGTTTCQELLAHGSFGLGTFDHLDGEMIILDSRVYQARQDGSIELKADCLTPFAVVAGSSPEGKPREYSSLRREQLENIISQASPSLNGIDIIRIEGEFANLSLRVAPKQKIPYPKLAEAIKDQPIFSYKSLTGTMVGFRFPSYLNQINVAGFHLHFISTDRRKGGHVFDYNLIKGKIIQESAKSLSMTIPRDNAFVKATLAPHSESEIRKVEGMIIK